MTRKPRCDSVLKTLPEERQADIVEHLTKEGYTKTVKWLRADGIKTSRTALSDFHSWWQLHTRVRTWEQDALSMVELLKGKHPDMNEAELQGYANQYFQLKAIKEDDAELYLELAGALHKAKMDHLKLEQKERQFTLARQKFQRETCDLFLKFYKNQKALRVAGSKASHADKIQALGPVLFDEEWQLEMAGGQA